MVPLLSLAGNSHFQELIKQAGSKPNWDTVFTLSPVLQHLNEIMQIASRSMKTNN